MATRWMKWNEGTHIFEYSTDGVTFSPLPLDASILTQGLIDPARLPAGLPSGGGNNVFTGINTLSNAAPALRFNETDAPVDFKGWDWGVDAQVFKLRTLNDAFALPRNLFTINRNGQAVLSPDLSGVAFSISGSLSPLLMMTLRNLDPGTGSQTIVQLGNDASAAVGLINVTSSLLTPSAWNQPNCLVIEATKSLGISIAASDVSAGVRIYAGGSTTPRLTVSSNGNIYLAQGVYSRGRTAAADGVWVAPAYNAGNFTANVGAWTVEAADVTHYRYTYLSGNSMLVSFDIRGSSVSLAAGYLFLRVPDGKTIQVNTQGAGSCNNNGAIGPLAVFGLAGQVIYLIPGVVGGTWGVSTNNTTVHGSIILDVN